MDFWMASNRLKLNEDKTQVIWLGTLHSTSSHRSSRYRSTQSTSHTHMLLNHPITSTVCNYQEQS